MKITTKLILGCLAILSSHLSLADNSLPSYYYKQDMQNLQRPTKAAVVDQNPFSVWCNDRLFILRNARVEASRYTFRGDAQGAVQRLTKGLVEAAHDGYQTNPPLTQNLIVRGKILSDSLISKMGTELNGYKAVNLFLENYYDLIEDVANRIDLQYFIPGQCGYCHHRDSMEFERSLVEVARMQVALVQNALLFPGSVVAIGPSSLYLKALEMMSYFASFDLRSSLFAQYYACQIRELDEIHRRLVSFNSFSQPEFAKRDMIMTVSSFVEHVIASLSDYSRCYR